MLKVHVTLTPQMHSAILVWRADAVVHHIISFTLQCLIENSLMCLLTGTLLLSTPADMYKVLAAELMTWSMAWRAKFQVINSQIGLSPAKAEPTAMPVKPACMGAQLWV